MTDQTKSADTIGYLTGCFPCLTHTFISREIREMEAWGLNIRCYSVHPPGRDMVSKEDRRFLKQTRYLFPLQFMDFLCAHLRLLLQKPFTYLRTLAFMTSRPGTSLRERVRCFFHFCEAVQLARWTAQDRVRHLHVHFMGNAAAIALVLHKLTGLSYSVTAHGTALLVEGLLLKEKVRSAAFIVAVSKYNQRFIRERVPESRDKVFRAYCGVDLKAFPPRESERRDGPFTILNVASLKWQKAHHVLIRACSRLKEDGATFQCLILGDGPEAQRLRELIRESDLSDRVHLRGKIFQEQILPYYHQADVFVLSSVSEGLPVVLMEAMAAQVPVIGPNITGVPEIIEDGRSGLLADPGDDRSYYEKIKILMADKDLRERMGRAGRQRVAVQFDIGKNAGTLRERFLGVLSDGGPTAS